MTDALPDPLVPAEVDLRDFGFMPLDVRTLLTSSLWIKAKKDPRVAHAAMSLWCEAWHQVPTGSLPDDDEVLADLARCDEKEWKRVKERALSHFVKCSDGRLYHRTVCKKALESWKAKVDQRNRTKAATEAREAKRRAAQTQRDEQRDVDRNEPRDDKRDEQRNVERDVQRDVHQGTGTVKGQGEVNLKPTSTPTAPSDSSLDAADPPIESMPLNTGEEFPIRKSLIAEFERLYPALDVPQTLREMRGWCLANPTRRKTKSGVLRFVNGWLSKEQNRAPGGA